MTDVREKPILFSGAMVRAILANEKTVTRRIVKNFYEAAGPRWVIKANADTRVTYSERAEALAALLQYCPYGQPGDRLWIRSNYTVRHDEQRDETHWKSEGLWVTTHGRPTRKDGKPMRLGFKPSMHMPHWLSVERWPMLEITEVRVERLQEINWDDIRSEGIDCPSHDFASGMCVGYCKALAEKFQETWDALNKKRGYSWESDPWVWAISFRKVSPCP